MNTCFTRREFLRSLVGGGAALGLHLCNASSARAECNPITFHLEGDGWDGFNRRQIVSQAMWLVNERFLDQRIATNGYQVDGNNYNMHGNLWNITNLNSYFSGKGYADILWFQLAALRITNNRPRLFIQAEHRPQINALGWANIGLVEVKYSRERFDITGDFRIVLNTHFLGGAGHYSDPYYWAGTIAHEMLHNLGHLHSTDREDPRYSQCQLIAHERSVYYNGRYRRGLERPMVLCGGRWGG